MTEKEQEFFREFLKNPLINPKLLNLIIPKFSVKEYKDLQSAKDLIIDVNEKFKWNEIRHTLEKGARLGYEFTELMSCISINRYLMFEHLIEKRLKHVRGRRKPVSIAGFNALRKLERDARKRAARTKHDELP